MTALLLLLATACAPEDGTTPYTWHADARPVVEARCAGCHASDGVAPFPLDSYEDVSVVAGAVADSIESGRMPPWRAGEGCNTYSNDFSLDEDEKAMLLDWLAGGLPEGAAADYVAPEIEAVELDLSLEVTPELGYTPSAEADDDYRCLVVPWPEEESVYVTGYQVLPDQDELVHHVVLYVADPEDVSAFEALDDAEEGEGYSCYGGPSSVGEDIPRPSQLGVWAPGRGGTAFPEGTGIEVAPGSALVVQMHYNVSAAAPAEDRTTYAFELAEVVDRPAVSLLAADPSWLQSGGMLIPAGEAEVTHEVSLPLAAYLPIVAPQLNLPSGSPIAIHIVGLHMHSLGVSGSHVVERADGSEDCMLDVPVWDEDWQLSYHMEEEMIVESGDSVRLSCTWDNSAENQPIVDGVQQAPQDVEWGGGTRDEMCVSGIYFTAVE
ncbi:MAG: monooxygenase [Alphaproteobacteria bacterium]|nr:monooxygenase [Alphaproteobacteria bacterium]MCB9796545.1 monooxygenase [Alphaproteobacteria bacterium]